ncbi:Retrovirus-related Pol polyprotein from transposon TNT 1-94-like protein [Drosera capensis]
MDVKTAFFNGNLVEEVYMKHQEGFIAEGKDHVVRRLERSIYGIQQVSRQWFLKFHEVVTSLGFLIEIVQCPKNLVEKEAMKQFRYASVFGSIMYAQLVVYSDFDFASYEDDRKSTSGYVFLMVGGAVAWKSEKQKCVSTSTIPIPLFYDDRAVVLVINNNKGITGSLTIEVKYMSIKERVQDNYVSIEQIGTDMVADLFTKRLCSNVFERHVGSMGLVASLDVVI